MTDYSQYLQEGFNLPHDVVELPSRGKFYKNKKSALKVGYLTAMDENILLADNKNNDIISTLLRNKIYETDFHPDELLDFSIGSLSFYAYPLVPGSINLQGLMWYAKISTENINEIKLYLEQFLKILSSKTLHNFPKWFINVKIGIFIISVNFERVDMN